MNVPELLSPAYRNRVRKLSPGTGTQVSSIYRDRTHRIADHLATRMAPTVILTKIDIASDLVGDTGIEPVTSSV